MESSLISRDRRSSAAGVGLGSIAAAHVAGRLGDDIEKTAHALPLIMPRKCFVPAMGLLQSGAQAIDFLQGQGAELPRRNIERERPVADALDLFHVVSDFFKHAPDLAIAAFDQSDFVPGIAWLP